MAKKEVVTKEQLIEDLNKVSEKYIEEGNNNKLPRKYYREHGQYPDKEFERLFGGWTNFRLEIDIFSTVYKKESFLNIPTKKCGVGNYFITSLPIGGGVDRNFFESILTFCKKQKSELMIMVSSGLSSSSYMDEEIYDEYCEYFVRDVIFNSNLRAKDVGLKPKQVSKLERFRRLGGKDHSLIVPSTKQMLIPVPQKQGNFPHIVLSTGSMAHLDYGVESTDIFAEQDHEIGGVIVEVIDDIYFNVRQVTADYSGGFNDLDTYYYLNTSKKIPVEAIASEPHFGSEDTKALKSTKDIIKYTKCKRVFFHDMLDFKSINHHEFEKPLDRHLRKEHQKSLEAELNYAGEKLTKFIESCPKDTEFFVVESNHDYFLRTWINKSNYSNDDVNQKLAHLLAYYYLDGKNPIEEYLKSTFPKLKNLNFLDWKGYTIGDVEWGMHSHKGNNGARGSANSSELFCDKATTGHSHTPFKMRGIYGTGCDCELIQYYNRGGGSSWIHGNVIQHANGTRQIILKINGKWKRGR